MMLAKGFALLLPFGSIAFRINLLSAVLGVVCGVLTMMIVRRVAQVVVGEDRPEHRWAAIAAGLLLTVTDALWLQSIRAEVYTLHLALILGAILLAVRWQQDGGVGRVLAAAVLMGLGLSNHHYLVFFFAPAPLLLLLAQKSGRQLLASRVTLLAVGLSALTLLAYAYLPVRSMAGPEIDWTHPTTAERFMDTVSAKTFQGALSEDERGAPITDNLITAADMMAGQLSPVGLLLGLIGLLWIAWRSRPLGALLLGALALNLLTKAIVTIDPLNPDDYGYYLLTVALLAIGCGLVPVLLADFSRLALPAGVAFIVMAAVGLAAASYPYVDLRDDNSAEVVTDTTLDRVAPNAVVLVNYYSLFFNHWHARLVDRRRPDVALVQATFDSKRYEGRPYAEDLAARHPDLQPVVDAFLANGHFPEAALITLSKTRPVYAEPMLDPIPDGARFEPVGFVRRLVSEPVDDTAALNADIAFNARLAPRLPATLHREARKVLAWHGFLSGIQALRAGAGKTALQILGRAADISHDPVVAHLQAIAAELAQSQADAERSGPGAPFRREQAAIRAKLVHDMDYQRLLSSP